MLINVLLDQFLNIKVSQGSVATSLRCDGLFNDQFITQSLLCPKGKILYPLHRLQLTSSMTSARSLSNVIDNVMVTFRSPGHVQVGGRHSDRVRSNRVVDNALVKPGVIGPH